MELCLLAAFTYWGVHTGQNLAQKILLGVGLLLLTIIFWGVFMAPKSAHRVHNPLYTIFKIILFGLAVIGLVGAGRPFLGGALGVLVGINILIDLFL